jgi:hypothetical protein
VGVEGTPEKNIPSVKLVDVIGVADESANSLLFTSHRNESTVGVRTLNLRYNKFPLKLTGLRLNHANAKRFAAFTEYWAADKLVFKLSIPKNWSDVLGGACKLREMAEIPCPLMIPIGTDTVSPTQEWRVPTKTFCACEKFPLSRDKRQKVTKSKYF